MPNRTQFLQNSTARQLFTAAQWTRIEQNPGGRIADADWNGFSPTQRTALIELRNQWRDTFGGQQPQTGGNRLDGGPAGTHWAGNRNRDPIGGGQMMTVDAVIAQAKAAPGHPRVKEPWDALPANRVMVMSLNVENLFREADDPTHKDEEFTTAAGYTKETFYKHLDNIGTLLRSVNGGRGPDITGLIEVEDRRALEKLVGNELSDLGYTTIALEEGRDERGIDVGLLSRFPLVAGTKPSLIFSSPDATDERGVLRAELDVQGRRTVVYINHWKSMRDGEDVSAAMNSKIAAAVRDDIAATVAKDPKASVMLMGDLNTKFYGGKQDAMQALGARSSAEGMGQGDLFDATYTIPGRREEGVQHPLLPEGTHSHRGNGDFLDRMMVAGGVATGTSGLKFDPDSLVVVPTPGRFFGRKPTDVNENGISDHKPLVAQFELT